MSAPECIRLSVRDLEVERGGRRVVRPLDFSIPGGHFAVIAGPSGSGKTSLLSCLAGLIPPAGGSISYPQGQTPDQFRCRMGMVFQHLLLTPNATAETNVLCGLLGQRPWWQTLLGFRAADKARAGELLERMELGAALHRPIHLLSGGERQRVAIARALIPRPDVLLADEPVSHLDPELARNVIAFLRQDARKHGRAVLCVLHDPGLAEEFADSLLTLRKDGTYAWSGPS